MTEALLAGGEVPEGRRGHQRSGRAHHSSRDLLHAGARDLKAMSGPSRERKPRLRRPIPERPPDPIVLPPTDPALFVAPPELAEIARRFNAGDYRGCVEPIEALFFARRNTFHQGLLQYVIALLQLRLGLVRTPRRLLRQALALLAPYPEWQEGVDLRPLRTHMELLLRRLPEDLDRAGPEEVLAWWAPPPVLALPAAGLMGAAE